MRKKVPGNPAKTIVAAIGVILVLASAFVFRNTCIGVLNAFGTIVAGAFQASMSGRNNEATDLVDEIVKTGGCLKFANGDVMMYSPRGQFNYSTNGKSVNGRWNKIAPGSILVTLTNRILRHDSLVRDGDSILLVDMNNLARKAEMC